MNLPVPMADGTFSLDVSTELPELVSFHDVVKLRRAIRSLLAGTNEKKDWYFPQQTHLHVRRRLLRDVFGDGRNRESMTLISYAGRPWDDILMAKTVTELNLDCLKIDPEADITSKVDLRLTVVGPQRVRKYEVQMTSGRVIVSAEGSVAIAHAVFSMQNLVDLAQQSV